MELRLVIVSINLEIFQTWGANALQCSTYPGCQISAILLFILGCPMIHWLIAAPAKTFHVHSFIFTQRPQSLCVLFRQIICRQYHGTTFQGVGSKLLCSEDMEKSSITRKSQNCLIHREVEEKFYAPLPNLPWDYHGHGNSDFISITTVVPRYSLQMIWRMVVLNYDLGKILKNFCHARVSALPPLRQKR